nr:hypothetical protein [Tanacetum cinerariifolium]
MTKVIKEEFKKLESLKISNDSFACNTSLEIFHEEFIRLSRMDDDLFTYEVEISGLANAPCDLNEEDDSKQQMTHESGDDIEGDDEVELTDEESSEYDDEDEVVEIFRINTNTYEWNKDVPWVHERPWMDNEACEEPTLIRNHCEPFDYKNGCSEWPTCSWKDDGYCNGGKLPGAYIVGNTLRYQYLELYKALKDGKLKDKALKNKPFIEGMIDDDDESHNNGWKRWDNLENTDRDHEEREYEMEHKHEDEKRCELFDDQERHACNIRRFEMIKYSFGDDEEYVAIKENEYDDLTIARKEAIHTYQEIFCKMDEGWIVTCIESQMQKKKSNFRLAERKVLSGRQPRLLFIFIESVFPDINTAY